MKTKLNIKKIIICVILIMSFLTMPVFARFVYNNVRDVYLKSQNFSFSSNLLTNMGKTYRFSNWSGIENYEIDLQLYSYENELSFFTYEGTGLQYTLKCEVSDPTKASAHIETIDGDSEEPGVIPNLTNVKDVKIYIKPLQTLQVGETISVTITASTTEPYKKQIQATFNIRISEQQLTYSIEDSSTSVYATLKILNADNRAKSLTLSFDPSKVIIDTTNECFENRTNPGSEGTQVVDDITYINSFTFNIEPEDVKHIRFYKRDTEANYTYPGVYESMVVTVTESNVGGN